LKTHISSLQVRLHDGEVLRLCPDAGASLGWWPVRAQEADLRIGPPVRERIRDARSREQSALSTKSPIPYPLLGQLVCLGNRRLCEALC
jgi:hypothetical protein